MKLCLAYRKHFFSLTNKQFNSQAWPCSWHFSVVYNSHLKFKIIFEIVLCSSYYIHNSIKYTSHKYVVEIVFFCSKNKFSKESTTHANEILHSTKKHSTSISLLSVLNSKECIFLNLHELLFFHVLFEQKFASVKLKIDYRENHSSWE